MVHSWRQTSAWPPCAQAILDPLNIQSHVRAPADSRLFEMIAQCHNAAYQRFTIAGIANGSSLFAP